MPGKEIRTKRHKVKRDTKRGYIPSSIPDPRSARQTLPNMPRIS